MTVQECYEKLHGDYEEAIGRLRSDVTLAGFLKKFPEDTSMELLREGVQLQNCELAFRGAHTLKGVAANLGFTELAAAASELTEQLRCGKNGPDVKNSLEQVEECYRLVIDTIEQI